MFCPCCTYIGRESILIAPDLCSKCGSLEGLCVKRDLPTRNVVRYYDWANGAVAPWFTRDGSSTYSTSSSTTFDALTATGLLQNIDLNNCVNSHINNGVVIDLGCGDANILRTAATFFGIKGIGLEIEDVVLTEANVQIKADNLQHLVSVRKADLMKIDLIEEVCQAREMLINDAVGIDIEEPIVIITMYLLPDSLKKLKLKLQEVVAKCNVTVIIFKWNMDDCNEQWEGEIPGVKDEQGRFTIYR